MLFRKRSYHWNFPNPLKQTIMGKYRRKKTQKESDIIRIDGEEWEREILQLVRGSSLDVELEMREGKGVVLCYSLHLIGIDLEPKRDEKETKRERETLKVRAQVRSNGGFVEEKVLR